MLNGLAQGFEVGVAEFWKFVRDQEAAMAESYLSGPEHGVSIDKANVGYQVEDAIENMLEPDLASG